MKILGKQWLILSQLDRGNRTALFRVTVSTSPFLDTWSNVHFRKGTFTLIFFLQCQANFSNTDTKWNLDHFIKAQIKLYARFFLFAKLKQQGVSLVCVICVSIYLKINSSASLIFFPNINIVLPNVFDWRIHCWILSFVIVFLHHWANR